MIKDDATQTGAESLQPAYAGRNAALAQIAKAVDQSYQEDLNAFDEATGTILPKTGQAQPNPGAQVADPDEGEQQEQEHQETQQQPAAQAQPEEDLETIVVDGQQVQVKRSQLFDAGRRTLQKEATADKRLQEATELLRQAQAYAQGLRQPAQPSQDAGQFSQSPSSDETNGSGAQARQATPDARALVREELWMHDATKAAQKFRDEFKDIAADPLLMRLAAQLEDERLAKAAAEGLPPGDPWEAYKQHGEAIRARFLKPQAQTAQPVVPEDKTERKRSVTAVVGSGARAQTAQPKQPLSTKEQIEQMRISRMGRAIPMNRA